MSDDLSPHDESELAARIKELELAAYEREHRSFAVFYNMARYLGDEEKRWRVLWAFCVWLASPASVVIGCGSLTAILGLLLAYQANSLIGEQNALLQSQTSFAKVQTDILNRQSEILTIQNILADASRRSSLQQEISSILSDVVAHVEVVDESDSTDLPAHGSIQIRQAMKGRVLAALQMAKPYRQQDTEGALNTKALSPERAMLFASLHKCGIDTSFILQQGTLECADFSEFTLGHVDSKLTGAAMYALELPEETEMYRRLFEKQAAPIVFDTLPQIDGRHLNAGPCQFNNSLRGATFIKCWIFSSRFAFLDMNDVNFTESILVSVKFNMCDLRTATFRGARISHCNFVWAFLPPASAFESASLASGQLIGAIVSEKTFLQDIQRCCNIADAESLSLERCNLCVKPFVVNGHKAILPANEVESLYVIRAK